MESIGGIGGEKKWEKIPAYGFALLDPRPTPLAKENNQKIFSNARGGVLGVEMTLPEFAEQCTLGNIDPQHTDKDIHTAAIDIAVNFPVPPKEATMLTVRPDLDAFGSMAVLSLRQKGVVLTPEIESRIQNISAADRLANAGWPGPKPLPNKEDVWWDENESLAAVGRMTADFKVPVPERIRLLEKWLETGEEPRGYKEGAFQEKLLMVEALEKGEIKSQVFEGGKIAFVESVYRSGTSIGYALAPVVVALNPSFSESGGEPYKKYTICQFTPDYVDMVDVLRELNELEGGWGGSPTVIGSPQGIASSLHTGQIVEVITRHLL